MKRLLMTLALGLTAPAIALAALYYEFNPDYAQSLFPATAGTVEQVFLPLNEYLAGFDVWVSTGGAAGEPVAFTLYNDATGAQVSQRTATPAAATDSAGGTRFHVNLPSQIAVSGGTPYRIRFGVSQPALQLYYAGAIPLLAHNGQPLPVYTGGLARIDGEDKALSFKFALYENAEGTPPQLSGVVVTQPAVGTVVIEFNATEPVDAKVAYGAQEVPYTGQYTQCLPGVQTCPVSLAVQPGETYSFTLTARDSWGNEAQATGQFTANGQAVTPTPTPPQGTGTPTPTPAPSTPAPTPDVVGPVVTGLQATNLTPTSATIAWNTNEAANGTVTALLLPYLTFGAGNSDATLELVHAVTLTGLIADNAYRTNVSTQDGAGNVTTATVDFITPAVTPLPPGASPAPTPAPAGTTPTPTVSVAPQSPGSNQGPTVSWSPPAGGTPADGYRIDIFDSENRLVRTLVTNDTSIPAGSLPDGNYRVVVYANNNGVYEKVAAPVAVKAKQLSFWERAYANSPYILAGVAALIAVAVGFLVWRNKHKPPAPPAATGPEMGAIPRPPTMPGV